MKALNAQTSFLIVSKPSHQMEIGWNSKESFPEKVFPCASSCDLESTSQDSSGTTGKEKSVGSAETICDPLWKSAHDLGWVGSQPTI